MATLDQQPTPSKAAIAGHPLHPLLVPLPIGFLVGVLASDLANRATQAPFWAQASYWLAIAVVVTAVVAALAGFIDFVSRPQIRRLSIAWLHFLGNGAAMLLTIVTILLRRADPAAAISGAELALSVLVVLILLVTGWLGGEMVFRRRVGVTGPVSEPAPARPHADPAGIRAARH